MARRKERVPMRMVGLERARKELSQLIKEINTRQSRVLLSARGKPQAVVLSVEDYLRNILQQNRLAILTEIQLEAQSKGLDKMSMAEINREIRAARRAGSRRSR